MKIGLIVGILAAVAAAFVLFFLHVRRHRESGEPVVQIENRFEFTAHGSYQTVAPLFGALEERSWAGDHWDPHFIYPRPAQDQQGEVFTVSHGHTHSTWVNTVFDLQSGHVQYVYFVPQAQVTVIDVHLRSVTALETDVKVAYRRTALDARLNAHIKDLGRNDARSGPEWAASINAFLKGNKAAN